MTAHTKAQPATLWDLATGPGKARRDHPATAKRAAEAIAAHRPALLERVHRAIADAGADGMTAQQVEDATGLPGNTVRPRIVELRRAGLVVESDQTRPTRSGRSAVVLVAPPKRALQGGE